MSNLKKVVSLLLAVAMVLSLSTMVTFAEDVATTTTNQEAAEAVVSSAAGATLASLPNDDVQYADAYKFDYALGLFEMLEDGYWQKQQVTRADFATIVAKMMKANTAGYPRYGQSPYVDLDENSAAYSAICYLTEVGILSGDGNSQFRPNDPILVNEASKMLMCALGYQTACEATNGGFPAGYTSFALRQGIYNGVNLSYTDSMTAMQMSKMVRNAMEAYLMDTVIYNADGTSEVVISDSKTLLTETYKMYTDTGFVTGTYFSTLTDVEVDLENEVLIDGVCYQVADSTNAEDLLGYEVTFYYMEDVSGYRRNYIAYMEPRGDRNREYVINARDITSFTQNELVYTDENGRDKTFVIDGTTAVSYNGKPYSELSDTSLELVEGNVKVITYESAAKASAVIIQEQFDGMFERYNKTTYQVVLQNNMTNKLPEIKFESLYHTRLTLDGVEIQPEDLVKNDVITYSVSKDGEYIRGYVSRNNISGTITTVTSEEYPSGTVQVVEIDGVGRYFVSTYCTKELTAGFTSDFQLTYDGRLLGTNSTTSTGGNYGYLINFGSNYDAFQSTFRIKVLDKYGNINEYESATKVNTNVRKSASEPAEVGQRTAQYIIESGAFADRQLIVYDINSAGQVKSIYQAADYVSELADPDDLDFGKYFNDTARYTNGLISTCAVDDSTIIFNIPFVDRDRDEDYSVSKKEDLTNGSYTVEIYDIRNGVANVIVNKEKEPSKVSDTANTLVVDKFSTVWDEERMLNVKEISGWSKGEYVSYMIDDDVSQLGSLTTKDNKEIDELVRGDVIQFEVGSNDYLYAYRVLFNYALRAGKDDQYFEINQDNLESYKISNDDLYTVFGQITSVFDFYAVATSNINDKRYYRAYPTQGINLYIYDTEKNEIIVGEPYDIEKGNQVFIRTKNIDAEIDMLVIQ